MSAEKLSFKRHQWEIFLRNLKLFVTAEQVGTKAKWLFATLALFLLGINALNVVNSYVGRDFMTAIENRKLDEFVRMALIYVGVFAGSTLVSVSYSFTEQRLGLLWRFWATRETILSYANNRVYYRLKKKGEIGNPDQRIADDIRTYCTSTLSFMLILLNASLTVIAFSGVMWTISPLLFVVSVLYAAVGTFMTVTFGRPLVQLNYDQLDREANLRGSLIYLRGNSESVAVSRREGHLIQLNLKYLGDLAMNFRRIIAVNRNLGFFTTGYNWLIQIIPALIIAPLFIKGKVEFGVITQSAIAFTQLLGRLFHHRQPVPVHFLLHGGARQAGCSGGSQGKSEGRRGSRPYCVFHRGRPDGLLGLDAPLAPQRPHPDQGPVARDPAGYSGPGSGTG